MDNNLLYLFNYNIAPDHGTVFMQQAMLCILQQDCKSRVDHLVVIPRKSGEGAFMIPKASGENGISPAAEPLYSMQELCPEPGRKKDCSSLQHPRGRAAQGQGAEAALWEGRIWKCCSVCWALNSIPACQAWLHVYFKEIQPHAFYFLPGLIDQPFKSRRDSRSGYPPCSSKVLKQEVMWKSVNGISPS